MIIDQTNSLRPYLKRLTAAKPSARPVIPQIEIPKTNPLNPEVPPVETLGGSVPDDQNQPSLRPRIAPPAPVTGDDQAINYGQGRIIDDGTGGGTPPQTVTVEGPTGDDTSESSVPPSNTSLRSRLVGQTWDEHRIENRQNLMNDPDLRNAPENKIPRWKAAIGNALLAISQGLRNRESLGQALGEGIGAGAGGAIYPKSFADQQNAYQIGQIDARRDREFEEEKRRMELSAKQAQIEDLRNKPLIAREKMKQEQRRVNNQVLRDFYKNNPKFDADNPTPAQARELASLGYGPEDIGSYNHEKPIFTEWLGSKMIWDEDSGTFKDTNLPKDGSKALTEITIKNPLTNEVNTYTTTNEKAASIKNSAANMGYQVIAQREIANARFEQQARTDNANNEIRVATENASNWLRYNGQLLDLASKTAQASGAVVENQAELEGINQATQSAMQQLGELANRDTSQMTSAEIEKTNKRIQELTDQINANNIKFSTALGKTKAGQDALTQIGKTNISAPQKIVAPKIQAVKVGGKTATRATVEAFAKKKGISYEEAKRQAEADGYTVQ